MTIQRLPDGSVKIADLEDWNLDLLKSIPTLAVAGESGKAQKRLFPDAFASGDAKEEQIEDWEEFVRPELEDLFSGSLAKVTGDVSAAIPEPAPARRRAVKKKAATKKTAAKKAAAAKNKTVAKKTSKKAQAKTATKAAKGAKTAKKAAKKTGAKARKTARPASQDPFAEEIPDELHPPSADRWSFQIPKEHVEDWYRALNQVRLMLSAKYDAHRTDNAHIASMFISGNMEALVQYELFTGLCAWWVDELMDP